jgi:hypothetical protein
MMNGRPATAAEVDMCTNMVSALERVDHLEMRVRQLKAENLAMRHVLHQALQHLNVCASNLPNVRRTGNTKEFMLFIHDIFRQVKAFYDQPEIEQFTVETTNNAPLVLLPRYVLNCTFLTGESIYPRTPDGNTCFINLGNGEMLAPDGKPISAFKIDTASRNKYQYSSFTSAFSALTKYWEAKAQSSKSSNHENQGSDSQEDTNA